MIVFDRKEKEIKVPEGLGNINLTVVDAILEDKTVEINEVETTILPSSGYNGMSSLQIDAQPVYDNGYTIGKDEGLEEGYQEGLERGYQNGFDNGIIEQKNLLTNITITENGTYSREDGYNEITVDVPDLNGSYDEGYDEGKEDGLSEGYNKGYNEGLEYASENANEIAAANAIDLVATDFGTYYTKYSDNIQYPQVTGVYTNGEKFYDYSTGKYYYDTGLQTSENTKIEIWFYNYGIYKYNVYYFKTDNLGYYSFVLRYDYKTNNYVASIGLNNISFTLEVGWHNIVMSFADGLIVDGEKVGDFNSNILNIKQLLIGGAIDGNTPILTIGMIKIDDTIIIPTADGLKNITTNELLSKNSEAVVYKYINNTPTILPNLIKTVNVQPKIDVAEIGLKFGNSTLTEIPSYFDFSNTTDMSYMFNGCGFLQTIPELNTSNVTNMSYMFADCNSLQTIPELNTRKVANMEYMFYSFNGNQTLVSLPKIYCDSCTSLYKFFAYGNSYLINNLTDVGGWINLKCNWNGYGINCVPNLTYQSCINILNGLYDFTGNGETPTSSQGQLKVHSNFLTTVGDEISIGTNKGWTITA